MSSIKDRLPSKVVFHFRVSYTKDLLSQRSSSNNGHLSTKVLHHKSLCSIKGCLSSFSIKGHLPLKVIFHHRLSSSKGCLSSKVVLQQRFSSIEGRLSTKAVNYHLVAPDVLWTALIPMHYGPNGEVMLSLNFSYFFYTASMYSWLQTKWTCNQIISLKFTK